MSFELDTTPPGSEALAVAEKELRETENNTKEGLAALKKYIEGEFAENFFQCSFCRSSLPLALSHV